MAVGKGFDIPKKSVKHYAWGKSGVEYVLVRYSNIKRALMIENILKCFNPCYKLFSHILAFHFIRRFLRY